MSEKHLFPLCCTADVPPEILDEFLTEAHNGAKEDVAEAAAHFYVVPNLKHIRTSLDSLKNASQPPIPPFVSPFVGQTAEQVASALASAIDWVWVHFIVLDERSTKDHTALVAVYERDELIQTVRSTFREAQRLLMAFSISTMGIEEVQDIIEGGVYGRPAQDVHASEDHPPG